MHNQDQNTFVSSMNAPRLAVATCYSVAIALTVLYYGGVYELPRAIGLVLICLSGSAAFLRRGSPRHTKSVLGLSLATLLVLICWICLQSTLIPMQLGANSLWASASQLGITNNPTVSIAPSDTFGSLLTLALPFVVFASGLIIFRSDEDVQSAVRITAYVCAAIVLFGLTQFTLFPETLLFSEKNAYSSSLTSVFVNRNTAGTFLGLVTLVFVIRFCELAPTARLGSNLERFANGLPIKLGRIHVELLASIVMLVLTVLSLFLTQSRGAMASFSISFVLFLFLVSFCPIDVLGSSATKRRSSVFVRIVRLTIALGIAFGTLLVFGGRTILRAQSQGTEDGRFCVLPGILEMANDRWLTGWGFGTFRTAFAPYRDPLCGLNGTWVRAHNAFLEAYAGLGIIFWPILTLAFGTLFAVYIRGIRKRRSMRIYALAGLCGLILTLLHSTIDFSIQIPGYATAFAFFCALTVTASAGKRRKNGPEPQN